MIKKWDKEEGDQYSVFLAQRSSVERESLTKNMIPLPGISNLTTLPQRTIHTDIVSPLLIVAL